jgi:hypothetical protein
MKTLIISSAILSSLYLVTGCAQNGCEFDQTAPYRMVATPTSGPCEAIDSVASVDEGAPTCPRKKTSDEGADTCGLRFEQVCDDGLGVVISVECEDDGKRCGGSMVATKNGALFCTWDLSMTKL